MTRCGYCGRGVIIRPPVGPAGSCAGFSSERGRGVQVRTQPVLPSPLFPPPGRALPARAFHYIPAPMPLKE